MAYPYRELEECQFAVVCVDTPSLANGACDISNVKDAIVGLPSEYVMLRSTVPPGTTQELAQVSGKHICYVPEYISESGLPTDFWGSEPGRIPFMIFGGEPAVRRFFIDHLVPILGPDRKLLECSSAEAEIAKYMENTYLALKVAFVNEYYDLCKSLDVDWHVVREAWLLDPRVERSHTAVFPRRRGFGGRCLPKDSAAIVNFARHVGSPLRLVEAALNSNAAIA